MTTLTANLPGSFPYTSAPTARSLYRLSIDKYEAMVQSSPSGPSEPIGYRHCEVYTRGQEIPLVIAGAEVGRSPVADLLP
jgi:hypothetical protein